MTWAYQQDSTHEDFVKYDKNQLYMYNAIIDAVKSQIIGKDFELIVPVGTAVQNARTSFIGDTLTRDGYHLSYDVGRYLAGLTLVRSLCGKDVSGVSYSPEGVSETVRKICKESAENAFRKPFEITNSAFTKN